MNSEDIKQIAQGLHQARLQAQPVEQFSETFKDFATPDAYSVQELGIQLRESQGEKVIGLKMGLTSEAKRKQMNLDSSVYGVLTDKMQVTSGVFSMEGTIHPKIEPEICFFIDKDLEGDVTREQVLDATSSVCAALEILDSRYKQFKYFSMQDVISDNSSSSHFALSNVLKDPKSLDLKNLKMEMFVNGELAQSGMSHAISGDPVQSIVEQCALLAERGQTLKAGTFVLAGAATTAVALEPGMKVELKIEDLGTMEVQVQ
ncbi:MAG: 4-oxalocrotonate decarboxylase [Bdellovibrionaceae bacterium]|nr:4-oxalocrotonate decarboxylase [Pseudobdellovibrionaceae bacterium]|tara:strand:+ start:119 stop:898 length:780 start_codon:yes stop_codon:yes gene_type:complete